MKLQHPRDKGFSYVFAVMILAILSLLAVIFTKTRILDLRSAYYIQNHKQAVLVAQAALDYAAMEIPSIAMRGAYDNPHAIYQYKNDLDQRIEDATDPSFHTGDHPVLKFAYSLSWTTPQPGVTQYATLRIFDTNALFNVNSPIKNSGDYRDNLMWYNVLHYVCGFSSSKSLDIIDKIEEYRLDNVYPPNTPGDPIRYYNYQQISELRHLVTPDNVITQAEFDQLSNYLTVHSWGNPHCITYDSTYDVNLSDIHVETRYPINMNIASQEMIRSALLGITATSQFAGETLVDMTAANLVAAAIVQERGISHNPIKTWDQFEKLLYKVVTDHPSDISKQQADAIFAATYPGMRLNKQDPDESHKRFFDKFDIKDASGNARGTTEFCLFSPGVFYMQALGRIVRHEDELVTSAKVSADIKLWEPIVVAQQYDFDRLRLNKAKYDTWTSNLPHVPFDTVNPSPTTLGVSPANQRFGYVFECNPETLDPCLYWNTNTGFEKRSDGLYFKGSGPLVYTNDPTPYWQNDGFDLWLKPGYEHADSNGNVTDNIKIAEEHELDTSATKKCHVRTRLAYENNYITLSRTYGINAGLSRPKRELPTRIFYDKTPLLTAKQELLKAGGTFYTLAIMALNNEYGTMEISIIPYPGEMALFKERVYRVVYGSFCSGHSSVLMAKTWCTVYVQKEVYNPNGGTTTTQTAMKIDVTIPVQPPWNTMTIRPEGSIGGQGAKDISVYIYKPLWQYVFSGEPLIKTVSRNAEQIEAIDINNFPDEPVHNTHKYSRTEYRANITLKEGFWYHITGRWDDLLVTQLTIHYWDRSTKKWVKIDGAMQWDLAEGPLHVWPLKGAVEAGLRYYSPKCTLYTSPFRKGSYSNKVWRYFPQQGMSDTYATGISNSSALTGVFDLKDISLLPKSDSSDPDRKDRLTWFGVVGWSCWVPDKKAEPKLSVEIRSDLSTPPPAPPPYNGTTFKPSGERDTGPGLSVIFKRPVYRYVYPVNDTGKLNRVLFNIYLADDFGLPAAEQNTYETVIIDQIWLYLIVQPQYLWQEESPK